MDDHFGCVFFSLIKATMEIKVSGGVLYVACITPFFTRRICGWCP